MSARRAALYSHLAAVALGAAALCAVPVLVLGFDLDSRWSRVIAFGACALVASLFAYRWPPPWRWGLWVSSPLWLYFGFVGAVLLARGEPPGAPIADALLAIAFAGAGAGLGRLLARRRPARGA